MTSEYLITVVTGDRKGAGTDASVSLVIKGIVKHNGKFCSITSYAVHVVVKFLFWFENEAALYLSLWT